MDPETKELLRQNLEVAKENNEMLKKLARTAKWTNIYRAVYWSIIILSSFGAYYFIQPYLSSLIGAYTGGITGVNDISKNLNSLNTSKQQLQDFLDAYKK